MQPDSKAPIDIVVLLHGIRTRALWYDVAKELLTALPNVEVKTIGYGRFDALRFLLPFTRHTPMQIVLREIRAIRWAFQRTGTPYRMSVLAHSFGTYNIIKILENEGDIDIHNLLLCGSVINANYDFSRINRKISGLIINDAGVRDIWPIAAKIATVGYGDSGTFGFLKSLCVDRFHDFGHGDFFTRDFMEGYWVPIFANGQIVSSKLDRSAHPAPLTQRLLALLPASFLPLVLMPILFLTLLSPIVIPRVSAFLSPILNPQSIIRQEHIAACRAAISDATPEGDEGVLTNYPSITSSAAEVVCQVALAENTGDSTVTSFYARSLIKGGQVEKALAYFAKSADAGDIYSIETLALYYSDYREPNESKSVYFYTLLASKGIINAYVMLGKLFETGIFSTHDYVKAAAYYQLASEKNEAEGNYRLGQLYEYGLGVPQDRERARDLYRKAIIGGVEAAEKSLNRLNNRST